MFGTKAHVKFFRDIASRCFENILTARQPPDHLVDELTLPFLVLSPSLLTETMARNAVLPHNLDRAPIVAVRKTAHLERRNQLRRSEELDHTRKPVPACSQYLAMKVLPSSRCFNLNCVNYGSQRFSYPFQCRAPQHAQRPRSRLYTCVRSLSTHRQNVVVCVRKTHSCNTSKILPRPPRGT